MSLTSSRFLRALRDLLIAMINATLILVALCLFLGLRLSDRVERVATGIAQSVVSLDPLRDDVQGMTDEISALRADLAGFREASGAVTSEAGQALQVRLGAMEARLDSVGTRVDTVRERLQSVEFDPEALVDHAIQTASAEVVRAAGMLSGCEMPSEAPVPPIGAVQDSE
ncbi:hypothetical protein R3X27_10500 [Tropicimonas sp. TH_r6]|uniref:hypothetical protein n=1 Tax=Tropicimonas sp. TH_r6 TaxID=3082085 RepID=UPI0029534C77|nr:hypothetical protein [Tropicimonas sp. TH_r6]MDV7143113.1 hypothetical protein [Tropicimonas sp. TH_r6]